MSESKRLYALVAIMLKGDERMISAAHRMMYLFCGKVTY